MQIDRTLKLLKLNKERFVFNLEEWLHSLFFML